MVALFCEFHSFRHLCEDCEAQYKNVCDEGNEHVVCGTGTPYPIHTWSTQTHSRRLFYFVVVVAQNELYSSTAAPTLGPYFSFSRFHSSNSTAFWICREGASGRVRYIDLSEENYFDLSVRISSDRKRII